jgi:dTDP-4-dehydrorhamnose reductase
MKTQHQSKPKRILILGARGMLGLAVSQRLLDFGHQICRLTRADFDANELRPETLQLHGGDLVINAVGLINRRVDKVPESMVWRVNALWPRILADYCNRMGAWLIHVSTDCVFSGDGETLHDEGVAPDATDLYGASKSAGEAANALTIRTSIIGPELDNGYSLLSWMLSHPKDSHVPGFTNHLWNGVTTWELGRALHFLIVEGLYMETGVRHVYSDSVSKYELLRLLSSQFRPDLQIDPTIAPNSRDMRISTMHPMFLEKLRVRSLVKQVEELQECSDRSGHWMGMTA